VRSKKARGTGDWQPEPLKAKGTAKKKLGRAKETPGKLSTCAWKGRTHGTLALEMGMAHSSLQLRCARAPASASLLSLGRGLSPSSFVFVVPVSAVAVSDVAVGRCV
jgi:hypothetical protein